MYINRIKNFIVLTFILIGLIACTIEVHSVMEDSFTQISPIPVNDMNEDLTLSLPLMDEKEYIPILGDDIILEVKNNSDKLIKFPSDYGLIFYIYSEKDKDWTEVKNLTEYYPIGNRQVSPKSGDYLGYILISTHPDLPVMSNPVDLRVVIIGTVYDDGLSTDKQVGAYTDITLQP